ncbi:MAG: hypothetical protein AAFO89_12170, partial [Planctomycetota bacterium]
MAQDAPQLRIAQQTFTSPAHRVPNGGLYQPDQLAGEMPPNPDLDETPEAPLDEQDVDIKRVARRLVVAFLAIVALGILNYTVLYRFDAELNPVVLLTAFGVILASSILSMTDKKSDATAEPDPTDCGCAVGMCSGPRPIGELSRKAAAQRAAMNRRLPRS